MTPRSSFLAVVAIGLAAGPALAQEGPRTDVELLGEVHGTRPPASYFELKARDPGAFTFSRGWKNRNPSLRSLGEGPDGRPRFEVVGPPRSPRGLERTMARVGPRQAEGTIRVPVVLGLFDDSPQTPPFTREEIQTEFFDGPNSRYRTITDYYSEVSGGRVELLGVTLDWKRSGMTEEDVAQGESALPGAIGGFITELLNANYAVDWGQFDNDGPDGMPNSGDDDGYVDMVAVIHPDHGAECGGAGRDDRIWSHKWNLRSATGQDFVTGTASATPGFGNIRIADYTVQPAYSCDTDQMGFRTINQIGVLAHELGHAFGLPDLYDTNGSSPDHAGIGRWGLMGSGSWGCSTYEPERPCHMSAWSKEQLGWVEPEQLVPGTDLSAMTFEPVESAGKVYRVDDPDGSGEYLLIEHRRKLNDTFDQDLWRSGLLVWHVDYERVLQRWTSNLVNSDPDRMGVYLLQADGRNDLGADDGSGGNRGDPGDMFPGSTGNAAFHAGSSPGSWTWEGGPFGLTLENVTLAGSAVTADLFVGFRSLTLEQVGGGTIFTVDGASVDAETTLPAAPYQALVIEAGPGDPIADGVRVGFEGWTDDPEAGRGRTFTMPRGDATLTANYGGVEVRTRLTVEGEEFGVPAGTVEMTPEPRVEGDELWFPQGTSVTFEAVPTTGYDFAGWTGPLEGQGNPATLVADDPSDFSAVFELVYGANPVSLQIEAAQEQEIVLVAENGRDPVRWTAVGGGLPRGLRLEESGSIRGVAYETGRFTLTVRARDAAGLQATADVVLDVSDPVLGVADLAAAFISTPGSLDPYEQAFLDLQGNDNGVYDLGDFRAWVLAHPELPSTVEERALVRTLVPTIRFQPGGGR
ncbi:MAG: M6 family metalloprotease domain-containing protein [Gemmatimonadota bacterium]